MLQYVLNHKNKLEDSKQTGGKFAVGIVDIGGKFATGINNTSETGSKISRRCC